VVKLLTLQAVEKMADYILNKQIKNQCLDQGWRELYWESWLNGRGVILSNVLMLRYDPEPRVVLDRGTIRVEEDQ
jgi:hypothetical protein